MGRRSYYGMIIGIQMGVLYPKYEFRIIYDAASKFEAKVDTVLKNKIWVWKPARCEEFVSIQSQLGLIKMKIRCSGLLTNQVNTFLHYSGGA
jgi:hypothetical protein